MGLPYVLISPFPSPQKSCKNVGSLQKCRFLVPTENKYVNETNGIYSNINGINKTSTESRPLSLYIKSSVSPWKDIKTHTHTPKLQLTEQSIVSQQESWVLALQIPTSQGNTEVLIMLLAGTRINVKKKSLIFFSGYILSCKKKQTYTSLNILLVLLDLSKIPNFSLQHQQMAIISSKENVFVELTPLQLVISNHIN